MTYWEAKALAEKRANHTDRDYCIMKNAFGYFSVFPAYDCSDYHKYEIVQPAGAPYTINEKR